MLALYKTNKNESINNTDSSLTTQVSLLWQGFSFAARPWVQLLVYIME